MAEPIQYCKVISLQINKFKLKKYTQKIVSLNLQSQKVLIFSMYRGSLVVPDECVVCGAKCTQRTEVRTERQGLRRMEGGGSLALVIKGNQVSEVWGMTSDLWANYDRDRALEQNVSEVEGASCPSGVGKKCVPALFTTGWEPPVCF